MAAALAGNVAIGRGVAEVGPDRKRVGRGDVAIEEAEVGSRREKRFDGGEVARVDEGFVELGHEGMLDGVIELGKEGMVGSGVFTLTEMFENQADGGALAILLAWKVLRNER